MHWFSWKHWTRNPPCFRKKNYGFSWFLQENQSIEPPQFHEIGWFDSKIELKTRMVLASWVPSKIGCCDARERHLSVSRTLLGPYFFASHVHLSEFLAGLRYSVIDDILKKKWAPDCMAQIQLIAEQFAGDRLQHWYNMASVVNFPRKKKIGKSFLESNWSSVAGDPGA